MHAPADPYAFATLFRCYRECRRNKRNTLNALAFEVDAEANLLRLQRELREHRYRPGRSVCFLTDGPKPREVFAADFRDRIVHHVLVGRHLPVCEPRFIHDSFACRAGKGTLAASDRLTTFLRQVSANGRRPAWALKLDVASFFASIDKQVLYDILAQHVADPEVCWLTRVVLFHDPTRDYVFRSRRRGEPPPGHPGYAVAPRKSLFGTDNRRGLPIGNLTSQVWANVYLDGLDQFVKPVLRCRWYLRYVDDLVLLAEDPAPLRDWRAQIEQFLATQLKLGLRPPRSEPTPIARGVTFVGWRTWATHRVVRRKTLANLDRRLREFERRCVRRAFGALALRIEMAPRRVAALATSVASYSGHLRHGATGRDLARLRQRRPWFDGLFAMTGARVSARWAGDAARGFDAAYWRLARATPPGGLLFWRVGRYVELYGPQRLRAAALLGLRPTRLRRGRWALVVGFPRWQVARCTRRVLHQGVSVTQARWRRGLAAWPQRILLPTRPA